MLILHSQFRIIFSVPKNNIYSIICIWISSMSLIVWLSQFQIFDHYSYYFLGALISQTFLHLVWLSRICYIANKLSSNCSPFLKRFTSYFLINNIFLLLNTHFNLLNSPKCYIFFHNNLLPQMKRKFSRSEEYNST